MNMDGVWGSQLHTPMCSVNVGVLLSREMRCAWTLLRTRRKGLKVRHDGAKDVTGDFTPFLHRASALEDLVTRFLRSGAPCECLDNLPFISLFVFLFNFLALVALFSSNETSLPPPDAAKW